MLKQLNEIIEYIEQHLTDDISLKEIAKLAGVSDYHFRTIFYYITGMTIPEYIKTRRLSEANTELLNGAKVTDVAFKYGYQSVDGFTRAFKKWSGFLPSEVKKLGITKTVPKFTFKITVQGGKAMEVRIIEKEAFKIAGVKKRVPMQFEGVNNEIIKLAESITEDQRLEMRSLQNVEPYEIVNASYDADYEFKEEKGYLTHMIGVLTTKDEISDQLDVVEVAAGTWAVFPNEGPFPESLQQTMARTYSEWLPTSDYEVIEAPSFSFTKMDQVKKDFAYSEIWIPVKKKTNSL